MLPYRRAAGRQFVSRCSVDVLRASTKNLVRTHVLEKEPGACCWGPSYGRRDCTCHRGGPMKSTQRAEISARPPTGLYGKA